MLQRPNSIAFLAAWLDACALWRLYMPHLNMPGSNFYCFVSKPDFSSFTGVDAVVVQRCCTAPQYEFIRLLRGLGIKIVYDLDDNVWEIPKENIASAVLNQHREGFKVCMRMTDIITVSTKVLEKVVRQFGRPLINVETGKEIPIVVVENRIDERMFSKPVKKEKVVVGWQGSTSHVADLLIMSEAIGLAALQYPDVTFEFRGLEPPNHLRTLENVRHRIWMPVAEYAARMPQWGWSIALAPLTDEPFNDSKSCIKMIEAAYCGVPCLASWQRPYEQFVSHDPELKWLLCAGKNNWGPKLRDLINDKDRREELGRRACAVSHEHYSYNKPHEGWSKVLELVKTV